MILSNNNKRPAAGGSKLLYFHSQSKQDFMNEYTVIWSLLGVSDQNDLVVTNYMKRPELSVRDQSI